jgi:hypothetical protein
VLERVHGAVLHRRLVERRDVPEREVRCPDGKRHERVREDAQPHHAGEREHRPEQRAGEAGEQAERGQVADEQVLDHVEREELPLHLRDRRGDGHEEQRDPSEKSAIRQPGTGCPRRASVRARIA